MLMPVVDVEVREATVGFKGRSVAVEESSVGMRQVDSIINARDAPDASSRSPSVPRSRANIRSRACMVWDNRSNLRKNWKRILNQ